MTNFTKPQMLFENQYTWRRDIGDGPYIGKIDKDKLDRNEGYEVLDFANSYLNKNVFFATVSDLHKLEKLIKNFLPSNIVMKREIIDFLSKNW